MQEILVKLKELSNAGSFSTIVEDLRKKLVKVPQHFIHMAHYEEVLDARKGTASLVFSDLGVVYPLTFTLEVTPELCTEEGRQDYANKVLEEVEIDRKIDLARQRRSILRKKEEADREVARFNKLLEEFDARNY